MISIAEDKAIRLNLGGAGEGFLDGRISGFLTVDLREGKDTDIVADAANLAMFEDASVEQIYASQILEHFQVDRTVDVLKEWFRVLKPGGKLFVSVPDFDFIVKTYQEDGLSRWLTYHLFGDQKHSLNYHYTCFSYPIMARHLYHAGFSDSKKVENWPFPVQDCSQAVCTSNGRKISLNVEATK